MARRPRKREPLNDRLEISLTPSLKTRVFEMADQQNVSVAHVVRSAIVKLAAEAAGNDRLVA